MNFKEMQNKMIFRRDNESGTFYTIGMSKKLEDGSYQNGYLDARFKKDVEIDNMTRINIKEAWLTFYLKVDGDYNVTRPYIFINDFEVVEESQDDTDVEGEQIEIDVDDLPF